MVGLVAVKRLTMGRPVPRDEDRRGTGSPPRPWHFPRPSGTPWRPTVGRCSRLNEQRATPGPSSKAIPLGRAAFATEGVALPVTRCSRVGATISCARSLARLARLQTPFAAGPPDPSSLSTAGRARGPALNSAWAAYQAARGLEGDPGSRCRLRPSEQVSPRPRRAVAAGPRGEPGARGDSPGLPADGSGCCFPRAQAAGRGPIGPPTASSINHGAMASPPGGLIDFPFFFHPSFGRCVAPDRGATKLEDVGDPRPGARVVRGHALANPAPLGRGPWAPG